MNEDTFHDRGPGGNWIPVEKNTRSLSVYYVPSSGFRAEGPGSEGGVGAGRSGVDGDRGSEIGDRARTVEKSAGRPRVRLEHRARATRSISQFVKRTAGIDRTRLRPGRWVVVGATRVTSVEVAGARDGACDARRPRTRTPAPRRSSRVKPSPPLRRSPPTTPRKT